MNNDYLNSFLSENERNALIQFNGSDVMREAVKKLLLGVLYSNGRMTPNDPSNLTRNGAFAFVSQGIHTDEEIGHDLHTLWEAARMVENAFTDIKNFNQEAEKVGKKENQAR